MSGIYGICLLLLSVPGTALEPGRGLSSCRSSGDTPVVSGREKAASVSVSGAPCRSGRTRCRPVSQSGASPGNGVSRSPAGGIYGGRRGRCDGRPFMPSLAAVVSFLSSGIPVSYPLAGVSSDERTASCRAVFRYLTERVVRSSDPCVPDYLLEYARAVEKRPEEPPKPQRKSSSGPPDLRSCDDGNRRAVLPPPFLWWNGVRNGFTGRHIRRNVLYSERRSR